MLKLILPVVLCLLASTVLAQDEKGNDCLLQDLAIQAALGDPIAQYDLAVEFHRGDRVPQDLTKAAELWRMATKAGVIDAFNNLGHLTYYGRGIKQDFAEGIRLWRIAARSGMAESQVHLAHAYTDGRLLKVDRIEAYAWASAGKHFSAKDAETGKAGEQMADEKLADIIESLTPAQLAIAKQRAKLYIARYAPK